MERKKINMYINFYLSTMQKRESKSRKKWISFSFLLNYLPKQFLLSIFDKGISIIDNYDMWEIKVDWKYLILEMCLLAYL